MRTASARIALLALILCCSALAAAHRPLAASRASVPLVPQVPANRLEGRYFEILAAYERGGDEEAAVAALSSWPESDVRKVVTGLVGRAVTMTGSGTREISARTKAAAILLHTHVAMAFVKDEADSDLMPPGAALHFSMAQSLLLTTRTSLTDLDPRFAGFTVRDWSVAVIRWLTLRHAFGLARQVSRLPVRQAIRLPDDRGARTLEEEFPDDAELLLTIGIMEEAASIFEGLERDTEANGSWDRGRHSKLARDSERRAEQLYRAALRRQPALVEGRLRLARLLVCRGESDEASSHLRRLLDQSPAPRTEYLANLFLGRLHQQAGRVDEAIDCYRKAIDRHPGCQVARLALVDVLAQRGNAEQAAEELTALSSRRREVQWTQDPWWAYPDGPYQEAADYLKRLHDQGLGR